MQIYPKMLYNKNMKFNVNSKNLGRYLPLLVGSVVVSLLISFFKFQIGTLWVFLAGPRPPLLCPLGSQWAGHHRGHRWTFIWRNSTALALAPNPVGLGDWACGGRTTAGYCARPRTLGPWIYRKRRRRTCQALSGVPHVLPIKFGIQTLDNVEYSRVYRPIPIFRQATTRLGFVNLAPDSDNTIRGFVARENFNEEDWDSFAFPPTVPPNPSPW